MPFVMGKLCGSTVVIYGQLNSFSFPYKCLYVYVCLCIYDILTRALRAWARNIELALLTAFLVYMVRQYFDIV